MPIRRTLIARASPTAILLTTRRYSTTTAATTTTTMASTPRTYEDAIRTLNTLQSNFAVISAIRASGATMNTAAIPEMIEWARRIGYSPSDFNCLNIIHVAGTKGKGSTCAFASSILSEYRRAGVLRKTGLYTSPHLRSVRERIQVDGRPLGEADFARYFFEVWERVEASAAKEGRDPNDKPAYFRFLTLLAFHVYVRENVDTAVFEVGVGGEYDSTNIIERPTATGITSLGIDHVAMLGDTIEKIAWNKAGIMKAGAAAFSVEQPTNAMEVLNSRASERGVELNVVGVHPEIRDGSAKLGLAADFQMGNASLAAALVGAHMQALGHPINVTPDGPLPEEVKRGLLNVEWPGRCQVMHQGSVEWNIDGAHTMESLDVAGKWFAGKSAEGKKPRTRVLIFNQQNRDAPEKLLCALATSLQQHLGSEPLFDHAIFCTNITSKEQASKPDLISIGSDSDAVSALTVQRALADAWKAVDPGAQTHVIRTIEEAVGVVRALDGDVHVLITGSLHLIGGVLEILDPAT